MRRFVSGAGILLGGLLLASIALPHVVEWHGYAEEVREWAERSAPGRLEFQSVRVAVWPRPSIWVTEAVLYDSPAGRGLPGKAERVARAALLRVERVELRANFFRILGGKPEITEAILVRPHARVDAHGRWEDGLGSLLAHVIEQRPRARDEGNREKGGREKGGRETLPPEAAEARRERPARRIRVASGRIDWEGSGGERAPVMRADGVEIDLAVRLVEGAEEAVGARPVVGEGTMAIERLTVRHGRFTEIRADISYEDGKLRIRNMRSAVAGGTLSLTGLLEWEAQERAEGPGVIFALSPSIAAANADEFFAFSPALSDRVAGVLDLDAELRGRVDGAGLQRDALEGSGNLSLSRGWFAGLDFFEGLPRDVVRATRAVSGKERGAISPAAGFSFDTIQSAFRIVNERIESNPMKIDAPLYSFRGRGDIGFDQTLNLKGKLKLAKKVTKRLGEEFAFLMDGKGRLSIPIRIRGTLADPVVRVREKHIRQKLETFASGKKGAKARQKIRERFGIDVQDLLRRNESHIREWLGEEEGERD